MGFAPKRGKFSMDYGVGRDMGYVWKSPHFNSVTSKSYRVWVIRGMG
jgi:hypothetical protein